MTSIVAADAARVTQLCKFYNIEAGDVVSRKAENRPSRRRRHELRADTRSCGQQLH
jgi:hypothetical protein